MRLKNSTLLFILVFLATLVNAQEKANLIYLSPKPDAEFVNPQQQISFRHGDVFSAASISQSLIDVKGTKSGTISGTCKLSSDSRTLYFVPDKPFMHGETITVNLNQGLKTVSSKTIKPVSYAFTIEIEAKRKLPGILPEKGSNQLKKKQVTPGKKAEHLKNKRNEKAKALDVPEDYAVHQVTELNNPAPGYVLTNPGSLGPGNENYDPYLSIINQYGTPVFYREGNYFNDFKVLPNDHLAFFYTENNDPDNYKYIVIDKKFRHTDTLKMGNGYHVDGHDLIFNEDGSYFLMAYDPQPYAMDTVVEGGDPDATVIGLIIQKLDANDNVVFQWRSWDHFEITDATSDIDLTESTIDYVHGNAMDADTDSSILISSRHMDEITKINVNTGDVAWRMGLNAKNNMFEFVNDTIGFSHQHDIRSLENGNITLYDNGNLHMPPFSQGLEYSLDEQNLTAELVYNYQDSPIIFGPFLGSTRRLPNGNTIIGWGGTFPVTITEADMQGQRQWEVSLHPWVLTYRAVKKQWETDLFTTSMDTIDYGTFDGYTEDPRIVVITNNSDEDIQITSTHNHRSSFYVSESQLPLNVPANGTANITVTFFPEDEKGYLHDVLTLNADGYFADTLNQRISRQIYLKGHVEDEIPPEAEVTPADGSEAVPQNAMVEFAFNEPVLHENGDIIVREDISGLVSFKMDGESGEDVQYSAMIDMWKETIHLIPDTLYPGQQYYVSIAGNAIADNSGNVMEEGLSATFTTEMGVQLATLTTSEIIEVTHNSAISGGNITNNGGDTITARGVVWSTSQDPTIETHEGMTSDGGGTGEYESQLTDLSPDTTYYVKAYATNSAGTAYGEELSFMTEESGIEEYVLQNFRVYPNPGNGVYHLVNEANQPFKISVLNIHGKLIKSFDQNIKTTLRIDLTDQPEGLYFIKLEMIETGDSAGLKIFKQ